MRLKGKRRSISHLSLCQLSTQDLQRCISGKEDLLSENGVTTLLLPDGEMPQQILQQLRLLPEGSGDEFGCGYPRQDILIDAWDFLSDEARAPIRYPMFIEATRGHRLCWL